MVMAAMILLKKAFRSILKNKRAYLACIALISLGVSLYIAMNRSYYGLLNSTEIFYRRCNLADAFAKVGVMPDNDINAVKEIKGVKDAQCRIVYDARVYKDVSERIITLRLISFDDTLQTTINGFKLNGNSFSAQRQIIVGSGFLAAHKLELGDVIQLIIHGRLYDLTIIGTAQSPEFVYTIKDEKEILPDQESFDIAFIQKEELALMTGMNGLSNEVSVLFEDGYIFDDLKTELENALAPYGLISLIKQDDQLSKSMLDTEIKGIKSYATTMPAVFIGISIIILYIMLKRVIEQERMEIGTLKAFGYSDFSVLVHYLCYGLIIGLSGGICGIILGAGLSGYMLNTYAMFFNIPDIAASFSYIFLLYGIIISVSCGCLGSFAGAFSILMLKPADAMRPPAPEIRHGRAKSPGFLKLIFDMGGFITIRSIARNKFRSMVIVFSIGVSFALMAFMGSYNLMIDEMMLDLFSKALLYDLKITLDEPVDFEDGVESAMLLKDVSLAEGILEIPVLLKHNHLQKGIVITGIEKNSSLYKIYNSDTRRNLPPPEHGVILTNKIAKELEVCAGNYIYISSPALKEDIKIIVTDVVTQNFGTGCFIEIGALSDSFNIKKSVSAIICKTKNSGAIINELIQGENIASIDDKAATQKRYGEFMVSYDFMIYFVFLMSVIVAFAIIYNTSAISLSERKREYATLRVLGMFTSEVSSILSFEYYILCFLGIVLGIPLTRLMKESLSRLMETESFTFPTTTPIDAYLFAAAGCIISVIMANLSARKDIGKFNLVDVLKERE